VFNLLLDVFHWLLVDLFCLFILSLEEVVYKILLLNVENVLVLFEPLKELIWTTDVLIIHLVEMLVGFGDPWELLVDAEVSLMLLL